MRNISVAAAARGRCRSRTRSTSAVSRRRVAQRVNATRRARPTASGAQTSGRAKPSVRLALLRPYSTPTTAGESSRSPTRSSRAVPTGPSAGMNRHARTSPTTANGTFTQNSHGQLPAPRIRPPITGPRIGPSAVGSDATAMSLPTSRPPAACISSVVSNGIIAPAPTPCTTRKAMRLGASHASEHSTLPTRNTTSAAIQRRRPPTRFCSHPTRGTVTPMARR